jgi:hypothetical protein
MNAVVTPNVVKAASVIEQVQVAIVPSLPARPIRVQRTQLALFSKMKRPIVWRSATGVMTAVMAIPVTLPWRVAPFASRVTDGVQHAFTPLDSLLFWLQ